MKITEKYLESTKNVDENSQKIDEKYQTKNYKKISENYKAKYWKLVITKNKINHNQKLLKITKLKIYQK